MTLGYGISAGRVVRSATAAHRRHVLAQRGAVREYMDTQYASRVAFAA